MIKTPLSTMIGGAFWTPQATILGGTSKTFDQLIKSLFANGEQGFVYDLNDLSTMFQDAAGTVPVTGVGQPVGLMLDKSKGLSLGVERLQNGDFNAGSANWDVSGADATHIITFTDGKVRYQSDTISPALALMQSNVYEIGKWYEVTVVCSSYVSGALKMTAGNGSFNIVSGLGTSKIKVLAGSTTFSMLRSTENVDLTIDSISVKEIVGNHAYQTTSASRPILRQNATTGAYYLEFDGSDDFLVTNNIDFTATDKISLFAGVRKLSDSNTGILAELSTGIATQEGRFYITAPHAANSPNYAFYSRGSIPHLIAAFSPSNYLSPTSNVIVAKASIGGDSQILRVDGSQVAKSLTDQGTGNYGNYPLYIGRRGGISTPFNGHIYSLIGVGRLSTDGEIAAIEKELAKRVGVTLSV